MKNLRLVSAWEAYLFMFFNIFTKPTQETFYHLMTGWVIATSRRTICGIFSFVDSDEKRSHDVYHGFFNKAKWNLANLWMTWAVFVVSKFYPDGDITINVDDTLFHKSGSKVDGAGYWRDAVRSTKKKVVFANGLNLVVITLKVNAPWGGEPIGIPINMRLHRKNEKNLLELTEDMVNELSDWFPERCFTFCGDGFFASIAGTNLPRTRLVSRIRHDAAIYDLVKPKKKKSRGAPRKKGKRLLIPSKMAERNNEWKAVTINVRGHLKKKMIFTKKVIWYRVSKEPILLVIVRDPEGNEKEDFFFTTDVTMKGEDVVTCYCERWSIEDTFKNTKQFVKGQQPQVWKREGPERAAALSFILYGMVWTWYILHAYKKTTLKIFPWYRHKTNPSFQDALETLRRSIWKSRLFNNSDKSPVHDKNMDSLIFAASRAA